MLGPGPALASPLGSESAAQLRDQRAPSLAHAQNPAGPYNWAGHIFPDNNTSYDMTVWSEPGTDSAYLVRRWGQSGFWRVVGGWGWDELVIARRHCVCCCMKPRVGHLHPWRGTFCVPLSSVHCGVQPRPLQLPRPDAGGVQAARRLAGHHRQPVLRGTLLQQGLRVACSPVACPAAQARVAGPRTSKLHARVHNLERVLVI